MMFPKVKRVKGNKRIAVLDAIFSKYIRLRDSDCNGIIRCITCKKPFFWKEGDAGHFIQRDRKATRFDEKNVNGQCPHCNRFRSGEQFAHGMAINAKWGKGTAQQLTVLGSARGAKLGSDWVEYMIGEYKKKVKELLSTKSCIDS